jgi:succinate dehydrogenase/fumarate reductase flavoprotein subunit
VSIKNIADRVLNTDVLIVGGGIAGCPAAVRARKHGLDVTIVEKADTRRSGSAAAGIDHFGALMPADFSHLEEKYGKDNVFRGEGFWDPVLGDTRFADPNIQHVLSRYGEQILTDLEEMGVPMKWDDGDYYWIPTTRYRGEALTMIRVHWENVKPIMAKAVKDAGVNVLERTMVVDLLTSNGTVTGVTAVNTRTGEFIVIKAKSVVMATGLFARCYDPETPQFYKYKFRYHWCPATVSGDGWAIAYRAGGELLNLDLPLWRFRERDDLTLSHGNFPHGDGLPAKQITWDGEEVLVDEGGYYRQLETEGRTPLYYTLETHPDDFHKRIEVAYIDERLLSFKIAEDRGFDPRTHRYEQMSNKPHNFPFAGISTDETFESTSLKGLFAVGDCVNGLHGCGAATISAFLVGDAMPDYVNRIKDSAIDEDQVTEQKGTALAPMKVKEGTEPMELESSIRYACDRYVGMFPSEGKLREGIRRLGSLRRKFLPNLMAENPHKLMRCLEVRNIMDLAEAHMHATLERKETRFGYIRPDYPEMDKSRDNMLTFQRMKNGRPVLEIKEIPDLKPEYA